MTERPEMVPENASSGKDLEILSDIAAKRRQDLQKVLKRPVPDFILSTIQAEVGYTIEPVMLPYSQMNFPLFAKTLRERYNLSFQRPDRGPQPVLDADGKGVEASQIQELLEGDNTSDRLAFRDGRFAVSRDDVVSIRNVTFTSENIHVSVHGSSTVAELLAKELAELLWTSTGIQKRWDAVEPHLQMVKYGTATKVNLGFPLEAFLNPECMKFIRSDMVDGKRYAASMVSHSARDGFKAPSQTAIRATLDDLTLIFHIFNMQNGRSENSRFRFSVVNRDEEGTGIFAAISELPFDAHVECLGGIKAAIAKVSSNT